MSAVLALRAQALAWRPVRELPEGPVTLWVAVFSADRQLLGAAAVTRPPAWLWKDGRLNIDYGTVRADVLNDGRYHTAFIIAVSGSLYVPVIRIGLDDPQDVRRGMTMTLTGGLLSLTPAAGSSPVPAS